METPREKHERERADEERERHAHTYAVGDFIKWFAICERMLEPLVVKLIGHKIYRALYGNKSLQVSDGIEKARKLVLVVVKHEKTQKWVIDVCAHLFNINTIRNLLLHYGARFDETYKTFAVDNRKKKGEKEELKVFSVSSEVLKLMTDDLRMLSMAFMNMSETGELERDQYREYRWSYDHKHLELPPDSDDAAI